MKYSVKFGSSVEGVISGEIQVDNAQLVLLIEQNIPLIVRCLHTCHVSSGEDFPASSRILELLERTRWQSIPGKLTRVRFFLTSWGASSPGYSLEVRAFKGDPVRALDFQIFYDGRAKGLVIHGFDDGTNF